jgi:hypothetical protein
MLGTTSNGTHPTMLGTTPTMLGTTPTKLGTNPTMLGTTPTKNLHLSENYAAEALAVAFPQFGFVERLRG